MFFFNVGMSRRCYPHQSLCWPNSISGEVGVSHSSRCMYINVLIVIFWMELFFILILRNRFFHSNDAQNL